MNELISVIIPVYKVESYLPQCLDSVLASTYRNLEIILVDDGSPDNCGAICDQYAAGDSRINVIHQTNQGLSAARNAGLYAASGDFVAFVDSDDLVAPMLFESLLWAIKYTDSDVAACEYTRNEEKMMRLCDLKPEILKLIDGMDGCIQVFSGEPSLRATTYTGPMVWNKLYRKEKIKTDFKKESIPAEDIHFNWEYAKNCNRMVLIPQALYYWRITPNSITLSLNIDKYVAIACVWDHIAEATSHSNTLLCTHLRYRAASSAHAALRRIVQSDQEAQYLEFINQASTVMKKYFRDVMLHEDPSFGAKVVYWLWGHCFPVWKLMLKFHRNMRKV